MSSRAKVVDEITVYKLEMKNHDVEIKIASINKIYRDGFYNVILTKSDNIKKKMWTILIY